ncbi:MAG: hypothetical protein IJK41_08950 [Muribaculaceae bacterium]|nr:hypothetical protein [Muribaculaceae bacterium]
MNGLTPVCMVYLRLSPLCRVYLRAIAREWVEELMWPSPVKDDKIVGRRWSGPQARSTPATRTSFHS